MNRRASRIDIYNILETVSSSEQVQLQLKSWWAESVRIGFLPTMGALHEGHISLLRKAQEQCQKVIVSIFVNPTQFNDAKDLSNYPRTLERDSRLLEANGLDLLFVPSAKEMYPNGLQKETYEFGSLTVGMEAANRPGHFDGVATVVSHLFDACSPDVAFFGEKDFQQLQIIRALVSLQNRPIEIVGCPIMREESGLAMSSRNQLLSPEARQNAAVIYKSLKELREQAHKVEPKKLKEDFKEKLKGIPNAELEYIKICDERGLLEVNELNSNEQLRAFAVVRFEGVRLLDNLSLFP